MERVVSAAARRLGLLHTVPALADDFHTRVGAAAAAVGDGDAPQLVHVVDPSLLATAIADGVTTKVAQRVERHIRDLVADGAEAVLVTCSSIGEAVEAAAATVAVPVLRVDAPMAAEAVRLARAAGSAAGRSGRVAVLATLQATLGPTGRLLEREASAAGAEGTGAESTGAGGTDAMGTGATGSVQVTATVVEGAIEARDAGDRAEHDRLVRAAAERAIAEADVVVLAQASMAAATAGLESGIPVLTSPQGGVDALLATRR